MTELVKKENITIVIGTFKDNKGNDKKKYKTIAELVTLRGDDGSIYQIGEIWGPHGVTKFTVYSQDDNNQQQNNQQQGQQNNQQQNQGGFSQQGQQQNQYGQNQGQPQQSGYNQR